MAERTYYCLCDDNCRFETMTREQIITAITQAVNEGTIGDIDTGFITTIKTINGTPLKFFVGSQYEYETLSDDDKQNLFAVITNDTTKEALLSAIETLRTDYDSLVEGLDSGSFVVAKANEANTAAYADEADEARLASYAGILVPDNLPDTESSSENDYLFISNTGIYVIDIFSDSEDDNYYTAIIIVPDIQRKSFSTIAKDITRNVSCQVVYIPQTTESETGEVSYWGVLQIEHDADYEYEYQFARCVRIADIY